MEEWKECLDYFQNRSVYQKLFGKVREKYASLGHLGGNVTLTGLTGEEKSQLSGFFRRDYSDKKSVTISASLMKKALEESKFSEFSWTEILEAYFGEPLISNKVKEELEKESRSRFFEDICRESTMNEEVAEWFSSFVEGAGDVQQLLLRQYKENPQNLAEILKQVLQDIPKLPRMADETSEKMELLPVFAARTTGNSHYYDRGKLAERILYSFLCFHMGKAVPSGLSSLEQRAYLYYQVGILKDNLSNDVLVYGIFAQRKDGCNHEGIQGFTNLKEPMRLTLGTLQQLAQVYPQNKAESVYVLENPAVFSVMAQTFPERSIICGNGQVRLAVLILMDLLVKHSRFYYAGDFDPEGLQIAQRLKQRYGEKLILWNYRVDWYRMYLSDVTLDGTRLKKLDKIYLNELSELKEAMQKEQRATYQETMLELLLE